MTESDTGISSRSDQQPELPAHVVVVPNSIPMVALLGPRDEHLTLIEKAFKGQEERYVVWGEGTTDEMCLGILLVTRP